MKKKPLVVSLYSGGGGLDLGFKKAGFNIALSTDNWEPAIRTLSLNRVGEKTILSDIREINFRNEKKMLGRPIDCLVGGPPCPAYSKSRFYRTEKKRALDDENAFTLTEYFRAVAELKPKVFLLENVHGFVYKPHAAALQYVQKKSEELGYQISYQVVNAADYGIPQTRYRFLCIGTQKKVKKFVFPKKTHCDPELKTKGKKWVTCGEVINDLDTLSVEDAKMQAGSKHKDLLRLVPPGDNYLFFTSKRRHPVPIFKWRSRYWSFLLKLSPDKPSWTIQASHSNNMGPFHWKNRFLRISEIKRIQTFPDSYELYGDFRTQWRQIGNAVPPLLAQILAKSIKEQYFSQ